MKTQKNFYVGLDIGTDSVGYAVCNKNYELEKFKGEYEWGVQLFDNASLCADRRVFRSQRRRYNRRQFRIQCLQEIFAKTILETDNEFYQRIKTGEVNKTHIFNDDDYKDKDYHKDYPTIHHLITKLMNDEIAYDNKYARLLYLALSWLVAHRGHFLSNVSKENISEITNFNAVYNELLNWFEENEIIYPDYFKNSEEIKEILKKDISSNRKYDMLKSEFNNGKKFPADKDLPLNYDSFFTMLCGKSVEPYKLFNDESYKDIDVNGNKSFSLGNEDEVIAGFCASLDDNEAQLIIKAKSVYDTVRLIDILNGNDTISQSKVEIYNTHKRDLNRLKAYVEENAKSEYFSLFRDKKSKDNYNAYIGKSSAKEVLFKRLKKLLADYPPQEKDDAYNDMLNRLETQTFLPVQVDSGNSVIPYQLYYHELDMILKNAEKYLDFLSDIDGNGISGSDKIRAIFEYRVPYFVGPLNNYSENSWAVRKNNEKIYPWNIQNNVDFDKSENEFIRRMTGKCTYLLGEDVLPKNSLEYSRFMVLNELNNLRINGEKISAELKQDIYNDLFVHFRKVTRKRLDDYLVSNGKMTEGSEISGIDEKINASLSPWHDFKKLLENTLSVKDVEEIILRITVTSDNSRLKKWLKTEFLGLSEDDINYISRLKYTGFGRLSHSFLNELEGMNKETGEVTSIMKALWETNLNLMELLSDKFTFTERIEEKNKEYISGHAAGLSERLDEMYISNSVKRPIIRSLDIVDDIVKAMGNAPKKIFVEMARGANEEQKNKRTNPRLQQILSLYDKCNADTSELRKELESMGDNANERLQSEKLYLYYLQLGIDMYTGERISLTNLSKDFDVDHIYPRSVVKDDSVLNNKVLVKGLKNKEKSDKYPIDKDIQNKMKFFWNKLLKNNLITPEKYKRLTRTTRFSEDEKWGFINRQLTETSQSTKAVATLLKERYPETEIVYVKAGLVSEFRHEFDCLKSRSFNDLHHAKDAYLNIVTGNVYNSKFTKKWFSVDQKYNIKPEALYTHEVICGNETVWDGTKSLDIVKDNVRNNNHVHMTRYAYCKKGGFFDEQPVSGKDRKDLIPRKKELSDTEKYGGYNKAKVSHFMLIKYKKGKKSELTLMPVLVLDEKKLRDESAVIAYAEKYVDCKNVTLPLRMRKIKINTMFSLDGFRVCLRGKTGDKVIVMPFMPFIEKQEWNDYIKHLERLNEKITANKDYKWNKEYDKVDEDKNLKLYDIYIDKICNSIYSKQPAIDNSKEVLINGRNAFIELNVFEQCKALLSIHMLFGKDVANFNGCDLTAVGGVKKAACPTLSKNLSNWKKNYSDVRIIDCSASGLYEKRSDNLLDLL